MRLSVYSAAIATLALAACGSPEDNELAEDDTAIATETAQAQQMLALAELRTAEGQPAGTVTATQEGEAVAIALRIEGLPAGEHGVHVHMTGACDAPAFESAGGHWNPTNQSHGLEDPQGQHAGDMPNLTVGEDGTGTLEYQLEGGADFAGLMDTDGSAFVVHAGRDDQTTDPSGDSGDRIACGVFQQSGSGATPTAV